MFGVILRWRARAMRRWTRTTAVFAKSHLEERRQQEAFISTRYYAPDIRYRFSVDGGSFTGQNFSSYNVTIGSKEEAADVMAKFPL